MLNITIFSLTIAGSFQKSPFLQISPSSKPCFSVFKEISANHFFSSFLITQTFKSYSIVEGSIFSRFITSNPVLSFETTPTKAENEIFYGDRIPSEEKNIFYNKNITQIINCKFMSIYDFTQQQLLPDVGLCIYTTKNTTVDSCYFFAIMSIRSGSAILFDHENNDIVHTKVTNSIFKSITQNLINFGSNVVTGGAVSHGRSIVNEGAMIGAFVKTSVTENCCFEKVRLTGQEFNDRQLGVLTYFSNSIKSTNLNFTNDEKSMDTQQYGDIYVYFQQETLTADLSFINFFNNEFIKYGVISIVLYSQINQALSLSHSNFINNTNVNDEKFPLIGFEHRQPKDTTFTVSTVQCNSELPFFGISEMDKNENLKPIDVKLSNSIFRSSLDELNSNKDYIIITNDQPDSNKYSVTEFDVDVTNNIISQFGYIKTSQFSPSDSFSNPFYQDSASVYDSSNGSPLTAGVLATIFGIISFIVFIFLLCVRRGSRKRVYEQVGDFDPKDQFDGVSDSNQDVDEIGGGDGSSVLEDIEDDQVGNEEVKEKRNKKKKKKSSSSLVETNNSNDVMKTQEDIITEQNEQLNELDEDSNKVDELD